MTDIALRSSPYFDGLKGNMHNLIVGAVLSIVLAFVAVAIASRARRPSGPRGTGPPESTRWIAPVVAAAGFLIWIVRPHVDHVRMLSNPVVSGHQAAAGLAVDATRSYWERSLTWMSWYLGPLSVAAAIIAVALLARAVLRGRRAGCAGGRRAPRSGRARCTSGTRARSRIKCG